MGDILLIKVREFDLKQGMAKLIEKMQRNKCKLLSHYVKAFMNLAVSRNSKQFK
jgi:hypothetical protein